MQREKAGADNFHTLERLLSRLAFDTFLFGTAIIRTSLNSNDIYDFMVSDNHKNWHGLNYTINIRLCQ